MGAFRETFLAKELSRLVPAVSEVRKYLADARVGDITRRILLLEDTDRLHMFGSHRPYGNVLAWAHAKLDLMTSLCSFIRHDVLGGNVRISHYRLEDDILEDCAPDAEGAMPFIECNGTGGADQVAQALTWYEERTRDRVANYARQVPLGWFSGEELKKIQAADAGRRAFLEALENGTT